MSIISGITCFDMNPLFKSFNIDISSILIQYFDVSVQMWMMLIWEFPTLQKSTQRVSLFWKKISDGKDIYKMAIKDTNFEVIEWAFDSGWYLSSKLGTSICTLASENGRLDVLEFMIRNGHKPSRMSCLKAKDLKTLQYLNKQDCPSHRNIYEEILSKEINDKEKLKMLKWIKKKFPRKNLTENAIKMGLRSKSKGINYFIINMEDDIHLNIAKYGNVTLMEEALDDTYDYKEDQLKSLLANAMKGGNIEMVEWLRTKYPKLKSVKTIREAAGNGNLIEFQNAVKRGEFDKDDKWLFNKALDGGNLDIVKWLIENKASMEDDISIGGCENIETLKYLVLECKFPLTTTGVDFFAIRGFLDMVKWCLELDPTIWDPSTYDNNDEKDSLEMINWLVSNNHITVQEWKQYYKESFESGELYDKETDKE